MLQDQIAASLENAFSEYGFAQPSVAQLKDACNVSLRTLYKYFPSKEAMIVAALEHRQRRYITLLENDLPATAEARITVIFARLAAWMENSAVNGCMSLNACAAFPNNAEIKQAVMRHKMEVRELLAAQSDQPALANQLFLIHEGVASSWASLEQQSLHSAQAVINTLMENTNHD